MDKKFFIKTFGCQMNKNDSSIIAKLLEDAGYQLTEDLHSADIFIVNTCSVRAHAEQRALGYISALKKWRRRRTRVLAAVGCMAQRLKNEFLTKYPFVDLILGPDSYRKIAYYIREICTKGTKIKDTDLSDETYCGIYPTRHKVCDFVAIMRGCDNFCSYCVVPYVRGRARSRPLDDIKREITQLVGQGVKDITLLGQNVNEYSHNGISFADLLKDVAQVPGLFRLRFLTSHPKDFDDATIEVVETSENICEWFHLPLQSGCNRILKLMNRKYTKNEYLSLINKIRKNIPEATITTDVIVGFPTETEGEFSETISLLKQVEFDDAYMYRYSPRKGTTADKLEPLPEELIKRRLRYLIDFQGQIIEQKTKEMIGKRFDILFEDKAREGGTRGKTRGNKDVIVKRTISPGEVREVIIEQIRGRTPIGKIVDIST
jgi:tRNA-2-methylthio-N6-dimethylallyladenosine synthase